MSATFKWAEDHGAATGSPVRGTTRVQDGSITTASNWKNADDVATAYGSSPITAGQHSYEKFLYGMFTGTWTTIGSGKWSHTATEDATGTPGSGTAFDGTAIKIVGVVTSTYSTPGTAANAALTNAISGTTAIGSGLTVLFSKVGPEAASPAASITNAGSDTGYTQYLATQLQTTAAATAGDTKKAVFTLQYQEN